ncbi:hypothetical protein FRC07_008015, partial [Ceratobasidium sp. 392]
QDSYIDPPPSPPPPPSLYPPYRIVYGTPDQNIPVPSDHSSDESEAASCPPSQPVDEGWISKKVTLAWGTSASQAPSPSNVPRGVKKSMIVSPQRPDYISCSPTELAIITPTRLRTFANHLNGSLVSSSHIGRMAAPVDDVGCSDCSSDDYAECSDHCSFESGAEANNNQPTRYEHIEDDVIKVVDYLSDMRFFEDGSLAQLCLDHQVAKFLTRVPGGLMPTQVRILVLDGHNGPDSIKLTINPEVTYSWAKLRRLLRQVPPGIIVVVILACCRAAEPLEEFIQYCQAREIIALAACERDERSKADDFKGDHFLDALIDLFEYGDSEGCFDEWEGFLAAVVNNMTKFGTRDQRPVAYIKTRQTPSNVFRALTEASVASGRGRTSRVAQS